MQISGYALVEKLHESTGSMVYRARREIDGAPVILKVLNKAMPGAEVIARFEREFEIAQRLAGPFVVQVTSREKLGDTRMIVMADSGHVSLDRLTTPDQPPLSVALDLAVRLAEALTVVHDGGIVHKDITPGNVLVRRDTNEVRITDFGISSVLSEEPASLVSPDVLEGTLPYIAPEQTGRLSRPIDQRADLYGLGATLYHLFSSRPPFHGSDALELVHAHLAKAPVPLTELRPEIPGLLSAIVLRLLAKNPEDRYQSARGVYHDLERCRERLKSGAPGTPVGEFTLGEADIPSRIRIPHRLYGREAEVRQLLDVFARVAAGGKEIVLVSGYSGVGKTAVIREVARPIALRKSYFVTGKFGQYNRDTPYSAWAQAFSALVAQVLTESDRRIAAWKQTVTSAIGNNAGVLVEVIPGLERILGPQPPVQSLEPAQTRQRLQMTFARFAQAIAGEGQPLTIFLDDLQWADTSSLALLEVLAADPACRNLLLIGSYRDNEVLPGHPVLQMLEQIASSGKTPVCTIELSPLGIDALTALLSDALVASRERVQLLAQHILKKTAGNPFFVEQLLSVLETERLLRFDPVARAWTWSEADVARLEVSENVAEVVARKIERMTGDTVELMKISACIGVRIDLPLLAAAWGRSPAATAAALTDALVEGLIFPLDERYKYVGGEGSGGEVAYRFVHDRVQQAAYSLATEAERQRIHLRLGRALRDSSTQAPGERIFELASHLNAARSLIEGPGERLNLAQLDLAAGQRALATAAFEAGLEYFSLGIELLGDAGWHSSPDLMRQLHIEATAAANGSQRYEEMERIFRVLQSHVKDPLLRMAATRARLSALNSQRRFSDSIQFMGEALAELGLSLPRNATKAHAIKALLLARVACLGRNIADLERLPQANAPALEACGEIIHAGSPACVIANPSQFVVYQSCMVRALLRSGVTTPAPRNLIGYAIILIGALDAIEAGYEFARLAFRLFEREKGRRNEATMLFGFNACVRPWQEPLSAVIPALGEGFRVGCETGDFEWGNYCLHFQCSARLFAGEPLPEVNRHLEDQINAARRMRQEMSVNISLPFLQLTQLLMKPSDTPSRLVGPVYDEAKARPVHIENRDITGLFMASVCRLILAYTFRDLPEAIAAYRLGRETSEGGIGMVATVALTLFGALTLLDNAAQTSWLRRRRLLREADREIRRLRRWAKFVPGDHRWKVELVEAERARVLGKAEDARWSFRRAIEFARENGSPWAVALAHERSGVFWRERREFDYADMHLERAAHNYRLWGAEAKADTLSRAPPSLQPRNVTDPGVTRSSTGGSSASVELDAASLFKAAEAVFSEIVLNRLLSRLMQIVLENAGAQRGVLLMGTAESLAVRAVSAHAGVASVLETPEPLECATGFSRAIAKYAARTATTIIIEDARLDPRFAADEHLSATGTKSVLCIPLLNQGRLIGVVYLENNMITGAFSEARVKIARILTAQAAISIENAILYAGLEQRVEERTAELREAQARLVRLEKEATEVQMAGGFAHEIRNALASAQMVIYKILGRFDPTSGGLFEQNRKIFLEIQEALNEVSPNSASTLIQQNVARAGDHLARLEMVMKTVAQATDRALGITKQALEYSTLGRAIPGREQVQISKIVHSVVNDPSMPLAASGIEVEVNIPEDAVVVASAQHVASILRNLVDNAREALLEVSDGRPRRLRVGWSSTSGRCLLRIEDTGAGISEDVRARMFEPFFTTRPSRSTGLGLGIVTKLIGLYGGELQVESTPGAGSAFTASLPVSLPVSPPGAVSAEDRGGHRGAPAQVEPRG